MKIGKKIQGYKGTTIPNPEQGPVYDKTKILNAGEHTGQRKTYISNNMNLGSREEHTDLNTQGREG